PENFKAEDLAAALKRRIDPADLYQITIRPVPTTPPRVEIILPTGGQHQARIERQHWEQLLQEAGVKFAHDAQALPEIPRGSNSKSTLLEEIGKVQTRQVEAWVKKETSDKKKWKAVLADAARAYPVPGQEEPYAKIPEGDTKRLVLAISETERSRASA